MPIAKTHHTHTHTYINTNTNAYYYSYVRPETYNDAFSFNRYSYSVVTMVETIKKPSIPCQINNSTKKKSGVFVTVFLLMSLKI